MSEIETMARVSQETRDRIKARPTAFTLRIRAKCLDCVGYQPVEVRKCTAKACFLWPFRMGSTDRKDLDENLAVLERTKLV